jgi:2'-5' RNA ligase
MIALPAQMVDRWNQRPEQGPDQATLYWHMLLKDQPLVVDLAQEAQQRLSQFTGLHMTPLEWLHMTTLVVGPLRLFSDGELEQMTQTATDLLSSIQPIAVTIGGILYHPEGIMLSVRPKRALAPVFNAVQAATRAVSSRNYEPHDLARWYPHITICYSMSEQPTEPIIAALGSQHSRGQVLISTVSLVVQRGPERLWDWTTAANVRPAGSAQS